MMSCETEALTKIPSGPLQHVTVTGIFHLGYN